MCPQSAAWSCYFYLGFKPYFSVIKIVLRPFANVNTSSIFVQSIMTVKPKHKCTVHQHLG